MEKFTITSSSINILKKQIHDELELKLNHIYDMGKNWLVSVRSNTDADLMDPYYIADKKTLKIKEFSMLNHLKEFNEALKKKVY